jgi:hypothetical protein
VIFSATALILSGLEARFEEEKEKIGDLPLLTSPPPVAKETPTTRPDIKVTPVVCTLLFRERLNPPVIQRS